MYITFQDFQEILFAFLDFSVLFFQITISYVLKHFRPKYHPMKKKVNFLNYNRFNRLAFLVPYQVMCTIIIGMV